jgi:WD40 repeat protein
MIYELADLKKPPVEYPGVGSIRTFLTNDIVLAEGDGLVAWKLDGKGKSARASEPFRETVSFAVSNDRKYLAIVFKNQSCQVLDITEKGPAEKFVLPDPEGRVLTGFNRLSASFSDTGRLATLDPARVVRVWNIAGPKPEPYRSIYEKGPKETVCLFPKGDRLIRGDQGTFEVWSIEGDAPQKLATCPEFGFVDSNCQALTVTPDGQTIITGHLNGAVRFWGIEDGKIVERNPISPQPVVRPLLADLSPDGRFASLYHENYRSHLWNLAELTSRPLEGTHHGPFRFAPDGTTGCVWRYPPSGLRLIRSFDQAGNAPLDFGSDFAPLCYSPDGKWLAALFWNGWTGTENGKELVIWDVFISPPKVVARTHRTHPRPVAIHPRWPFPARSCHQSWRRNPGLGHDRTRAGPAIRSHDPRCALRALARW